MVAPIILISLGFLAASYFLFEKIKAYSVKAVCIKAVASMLFISLAAYGFYKNGLHIFPLFAIIALALGMLGDVALDLKYVFREKDYEFTMAGFTAFGLGHILYITGMFLEFYHGQNVLYVMIPIILAIMMGPVTMFIGKLSRVKYGRFKWIALVYAMTLFGTTFTAFSLWIMSGFSNNGLMLLFIGGVLFAVSDLILNLTYFGVGHEKPFDIISNTYTYYAAQFIIALSILFI